MSPMKFEIDPELKSLSIEDDFAINTYYVEPESKRFERHFRIKDDAFAATSIYEYRLESDPPNVLIKLIEQYTEPPQEYQVKDGVVLESELRKQGVLKEDRIADLKKEIEWHKLEEFSYSGLFFYIISFHPEVITNAEYRKTLRQQEERIKLGISKVVDSLKSKDKTGLEVFEDEYGGYQIWYKNDKSFSKQDLEEKFKYIDKEFYTPLFKVGGKEYCGITSSEFRNGPGILRIIERFLNITNESKKRTEQEIVKIEKHNENNNAVKWLLVVAIFIIAYYWGVWTAIGVLIIGLAIYLLFNNKT